MCDATEGGLGLEWRSCPQTFLFCDCGQAPHHADHGAQLQVTSGYARTPSALPLQPVTPAPLPPAPGSPGPVATLALLCPALPPVGWVGGGVCARVRVCAHSRAHAGVHTRWALWKSTEIPLCLCSDHTPLQTTWTRWVVSLFLLGWAGHIFVLIEWPCFPWATDEELLYSFRTVASV